MDAGIGFRIRDLRAYQNGQLVREERCEYQMSTAGIPFPSVYLLRVLEPDGSALETEYQLRSVELNVPIDPEEFRVPIPPDARIIDGLTGKEMKPGDVPKIGEQARALLRVGIEGLAKEILEGAVDQTKQHLMEDYAQRTVMASNQGATPVKGSASSEAPVEHDANFTAYWLFIAGSVCVVLVTVAYVLFRKRQRVIR